MLLLSRKERTYTTDVANNCTFLQKFRALFPKGKVRIKMSRLPITTCASRSVPSSDDGLRRAFDFRMISLGHIREITRYPVKSMAGIPVDSAMLGWHGLAGDRRFAFRRIGEDNGFPWLTASKLPELLLYQPVGLDESSGEPLPIHVRTPSGAQLELRSAELNAEIGKRFGSEVELMRLKHGIFDAAPVSVISLTTMAAIGRESGIGADIDRRRFRANIVLETESHEPFLEDDWIGGTLVFGDSDASAAVHVTMPDERCVMINLDPDTSAKDARLMKTVVQLNQNNAGVYASVIRQGIVSVGDRVRLLANTNSHDRDNGS